MEINCNTTPFSMRGSYIAISYLPENYHNTGNPAGLYIRNIHGADRTRLVGRIVPLIDGEPVEYNYHATESEIVITLVGGQIRICYANTDTLLFDGAGNGVALRIDQICGRGDYAHQVPYGDLTYYMLNCTKNCCRYIVGAQCGNITLVQDWDVDLANSCHVDFTSQDGKFTAAFEEVPVEWTRKELKYDYDSCRKQREREFNEFCTLMPSAPEKYAAARQLSAYINWASMVKQYGNFKREAMLMSKNHMCNVWSWDHCFNAIAFSYGCPQSAWDQLMIMFDYQHESGCIPDYVNDSYLEQGFRKPPIHGWALSKMMKNMPLNQCMIAEAYDKLSKFTEWWLSCRDSDNDGVCEYYHGNDSGWDNSTAFKVNPAVELPDLSAFLIIQMNVLSELADKLGLSEKSSYWKSKAATTLDAMLRHCFDGVTPIAKVNKSHEIVENDSLILYLPIILGKTLPDNIREHMIDVLKSDKFLTQFGYATESPKSPLYESDGYWRGPIWAPSSMVIIDGLYQSGEVEAAKAAAEKFCELINKSAAAENFDALTGEGYRDRAYTWTSSVFLILAHDYLL